MPKRRPSPGALRKTGRDYDLAIAGAGNFSVRDASGRTLQTRAGSFERTIDGTLVDGRGRTLIGKTGPLRVPERATIDETGTRPRRWRDDGQSLDLPHESSLQCGFVETSSVDAVAEMVGIVDASRSFESAQKVCGRDRRDPAEERVRRCARTIGGYMNIALTVAAGGNGRATTEPRYHRR